MSKRLKIPYPVIVEGAYDKMRLQNVIEAQILTTDGFGVFNDTEKRKLFLALAARTPIVVLTDSDGAGKLIRSHLTSMIPSDRLIHLYTPRLKGIEKRKKKPSAEGVLGVEGMENALLLELFAPYESDVLAGRMSENPISKTDLYLDGLTGQDGSGARRNALCEQLGLPTDMTPNAFLAALRVLCTYEEYCALVGRE